jgi:hypothetical protein
MRYYIVENNEKQGPFTISELATKNVMADTLVWHEGLETWIPASQVAELSEIISSAPVPPPINTQQPYQNPYTQPYQQQNMQEYPNRKKTRWGCIIPVIIAIFAFVLLAATCPNKEQHKDAVMKVVNEMMQKEMKNAPDGTSEYAGTIASGIMDIAFDKYFDVHNYVLFSVGEINFKGKSKTVSFGILGHVFTFNQDDLNNDMMNSQNKIENTGKESSNDNDDMTEQPTQDESGTVDGQNSEEQNTSTDEGTDNSGENDKSSDNSNSKSEDNGSQNE